METLLILQIIPVTIAILLYQIVFLVQIQPNVLIIFFLYQIIINYFFDRFIM